MKPPGNSQFERWYLLIWLIISTWIVACAFLVQGEYGDGYQTIVNARYFYGDTADYYVQRGPLAALALWPVEMVVQALGLDPIDVRPYHVFSGALHSAYLLGCWLLLRRAPGSDGARLVAFATAVLTVVFYAYSPYLSHDLVPGLLFLLLIFLCHRWLERPTWPDAAYLVLLGAAVTLIKQTYAIFWISLVLFALLSATFKWHGARDTVRKLSTLTGFAALSAIISWLGYAAFIGGDAPDVAFLVRPFILMGAVSTQYGEDLSGLFATDLYLRNLPNYGVAAMLLVIPGIVMAFRGTDARMRLIAVCWLVAAIIMQVVGFREVRYLAFLAPLTAMLIVPVVQLVLSRKSAAIVLVLLVLVDQYRGITVASHQVLSTNSINVMRLMNAPQGDGRVVMSRALSFVYHGKSPLARDRYHGIYHLMPKMLHELYENRIEVVTVEDPRALGVAQIEPGDRVYYSNNTMIRRPPWKADNQPVDIANLLLVAGEAATMNLELRNGNYEREDNDGSYVMLIPARSAGPQMPLITTGVVSADAASALFGVVPGRARISVTGINVRALCQADSCSYR